MNTRPAAMQDDPRLLARVRACTACAACAAHLPLGQTPARHLPGEPGTLAEAVGRWRKHRHTHRAAPPAAGSDTLPPLRPDPACLPRPPAP